MRPQRQDTSSSLIEENKFDLSLAQFNSKTERHGSHKEIETEDIALDLSKKDTKASNSTLKFFTTC